MLIEESYHDIEVAGLGTMRVHTLQPAGVGAKLPGIVLYSEIYQVTGPVMRLGRQLASEGFMVAAPEVYHELLPIGTVLKYNDQDTETGNKLKVGKTCEAYDAGFKAVIEWVMARESCNGFVGTIGMCLGGHLALRAAFHPAVKAAVCLFPTDVHSGTLGKNGDDTINRLSELGEAEVLMIFGRQDRHVPLEGREKIKKAMEECGAGFSWMELNARHAFIRDELSKGRYDASLAQICLLAALEIFRRRLILQMPIQRDVQPQATAAGGTNC
mmetsp:Transcript_13302/g.23875  ORF Transcript_13302/g.23875 Transcript_13302/m.23875 type:complete len:271 (-) Transcript_13302:2182-2994(-)